MLRTTHISGFAPAAGRDPYWDKVVCLLLMEGADGGTSFVDAKGHSFSATGATISTTTPRYGVSRGRFNGSTQYIEAAASSDFAFGAGDFTIEAFVDVSASTGYGPIVETRTADVATDGISLIITTGLKVGSYGGAGGAPGGTAVLSAGSLAHVALCRTGGYETLYVNGVQDSQAADSRNHTANLCKINKNVGGAGYYFTGYVDSVRITKGVARYASNFVVPDGIFPDF